MDGMAIHKVYIPVPIHYGICSISHMNIMVDSYIVWGLIVYVDCCGYFRWGRSVRELLYKGAGDEKVPPHVGKSSKW